MPSGDREPDQLWLMLGEMRQQHKESAAERAVTRQMLADLAQKVDRLIVVTKDIPELKKKVDKHDGAYQRSLGVIATVSAVASIAFTVAIEWLKAKLA